MKDVKIKDAPLLEQVSGSEKIPVSDGSGQPKTVSVDQIKAGLATEESVGNAIEHTTTSIAAHNTNNEAHADIRKGITSAVSTHNADEAAHPAIMKSMNTAFAKRDERILSLEDFVVKNDRSFGIRWSTEDTVKTIEYVGNISLVDKFKDWVDNSPLPCEIKKDGTDFAYLTNTAGVASSTNWLTRADGSSSHYQSDDKADYLQMVELKSINIGFESDETYKTMTVWFNLDEECPNGFHPWFKNGKKLIARYDSTFNADGSTIDACYGTTQPTGNWSFNLAHTQTKATNANLLNLTAWEIICLTWIQSAYYKSFDMQTALAGGIQSGSESAARNYVNGSTDTLTTPHGKISSGAFRFMYMENAFWGKQWIMGFGWRGQNGTGYLTFDDVKANKAATMSLDDADVTMSYLTNTNGSYMKNVDFFTMPIEVGGSTTSGFYDGNWSNTYNDRIFYAGGSSGAGAICGAFARRVDSAASSAAWVLRARCAMNR